MQQWEMQCGVCACAVGGSHSQQRVEAAADAFLVFVMWRSADQSCDNPCSAAQQLFGASSVGAVVANVHRCYGHRRRRWQHTTHTAVQCYDCLIMLELCDGNETGRGAILTAGGRGLAAITVCVCV